MPPGVTTFTSTVPLPAGATAVIWLVETIATAVAATPPKFTTAGLAKLVPMMVTAVPPAPEPLAGLMPVDHWDRDDRVIGKLIRARWWRWCPTESQQSHAPYRSLRERPR